MAGGLTAAPVGAVVAAAAAAAALVGAGVDVATTAAAATIDCVAPLAADSSGSCPMAE